MLGCYESKKDLWISAGYPALDTEATNAVKTLEENF